MIHPVRGMHVNLLDTLRDRGFIEQTTNDEGVYALLESPATAYIGFDPTASSLHVGSLIPIMALAHMQRHGHRPVALVGGGTALVGDPSGKTEMRQMLTLETVRDNAEGIKEQLARFISFEEGRALLTNNADWLTELRYIPFLRDIGRHFSVNRMLAAESCKLRLEKGLSFIEFNYSVLQAYDFLHLFRTQGCSLQMGGSDQWGNIVSGIELIRRMGEGEAYGITFPLITTSSGEKMGKTAKGAVWLDRERTSPYEYYQFWVNTDDRDVRRFMALFTFLPMEEVAELDRLSGVALNAAKCVLGFEATRLVHGEESAAQAYSESVKNFGAPEMPSDVMPSSGVHKAVARGGEAPSGGHKTTPTEPDAADSFLNASDLAEGIPAFKLFHQVGLVRSKGEARRLIEQGGAYANGIRVEAFDTPIGSDNVEAGEIVLRAGKKRYHRIGVK